MHKKLFVTVTLMDIQYQTIPSVFLCLLKYQFKLSVVLYKKIIKKNDYEVNDAIYKQNNKTKQNKNF